MLQRTARIHFLRSSVGNESWVPHFGYANKVVWPLDQVTMPLDAASTVMSGCTSHSTSPSEAIYPAADHPPTRQLSQSGSSGELSASSEQASHLLFVPDAMGNLPVHLAVETHFKLQPGEYPWKLIINMVDWCRVQVGSRAVTNTSCVQLCAPMRQCNTPVSVWVALQQWRTTDDAQLATELANRLSTGGRLGTLVDRSGRTMIQAAR